MFGSEYDDVYVFPWIENLECVSNPVLRLIHSRNCSKETQRDHFFLVFADR